MEKQKIKVYLKENSSGKTRRNTKGGSCCCFHNKIFSKRRVSSSNYHFMLQIKLSWRNGKMEIKGSLYVSFSFFCKKFESKQQIKIKLIPKSSPEGFGMFIRIMRSIGTIAFVLWFMQFNLWSIWFCFRSFDLFCILFKNLFHYSQSLVLLC